MSASELAAKPPQAPIAQTKLSKSASASPSEPRPFRDRAMEYHPDNDADPWNTPDLHKGHNHGPPGPKINGGTVATEGSETPSGETYTSMPTPTIAGRSVSTYDNGNRGSGASAPDQGALSSTPGGNGAWGYFPDSGSAQNNNTTSPFTGAGAAGGAGRTPGANPPPSMPRAVSSGRTGNAVEENITVVLMPEKEGLFMFQHHNYEVTSARRGSKVIRRYSDFVWLLDCLHKRYPFRVLPLLPPKRVAGKLRCRSLDRWTCG
jgi:sorting nexin-8